MAFPQNIDFDNLMHVALNEVHRAYDAWMEGEPHSEEAFMNQVIGRIKKRRRDCDIGVRDRVIMRAESVTLHRRGTNQSDAYGADLAITINVVDYNYIKTALFQFKKSNNYLASVEGHQLREAASDDAIRDRSFVLAIDEERPGIRITDVPSLLNTFRDSQATKQFDCSTWDFLTTWLWSWLSCTVGPESDSDDPNSVERRLESFIERERLKTPWRSPWSSTLSGISDVDMQNIPAKIWLLLEFETKHPDSNSDKSH